MASFFGCMLILLQMTYLGWILLTSTTPTVNAKVPRTLSAQTKVRQPYSDASEDLLALINHERQSRGLTRLSVHPDLTNLAAHRVADMAGRQYYSHRDPEGNYFYDYFSDTSMKNAFSCENLDLRGSHEAHLFIGDWMASTKGHRECLLSPEITHVGFAVVRFTSTESNENSETYLAVAVLASLAQE